MGSFFVFGSPLPPMTCPVCGLRQAWRSLLRPAALCMVCGSGLRLPPAYVRSIKWLSIVIAGMASFLAGCEVDVQLGALLLWLPAAVVVAGVSLYLFPPELELTGSFDGGVIGHLLLSPGASEANDLPQHEKTSETVRPSDADTFRALRAPQFDVMRPPRTLEGAGVAMLLAAIFLLGVYRAALPLLFRIAPEYGATKHGPSSFPVTVHVGDDALRVTNRSTARWTCTAVLGSFASHEASADIAGGAFRDFLYSEFTGDTRTDSRVRAAARDFIKLDCLQWPDASAGIAGRRFSVGW